MIAAIKRLLGIKPAKPGDDKRSPRWPAERALHLRLYPACAVCGTKNDIDVHHKKPFHLYPELELVITNLMTLCTTHHLLFGHLGDWRAWNKAVDKDVELWKEKFQWRLYHRQYAADKST
jgi:5-methylcytosine-specific restriction endonuclease McrA